MTSGEEHIPDEFEAHARIWRASARLAERAARIVQREGLDPELAERVRFAAVEANDHELTTQAASDLLAALNEKLAEAEVD